MESLIDRIKGYGLKLLELRLTKTDDNLIKEREGKSGKTFKYVTTHTATRWLDIHYPGLWSFKIMNQFFREDFSHYYVHGRLEIKDPVTEYVRVYDDMGISETKYSKNSGEAIEQMYYKNAVSDALKRCTKTAGGFNDVYSEDDEGFTDINNIDWDYIFNNIELARGKFTGIKIYNQLMGLAFGTINIEEVMELWNAD